MTQVKIHNGPGARDLEQAFVARKLGATVSFSVFLKADRLSVLPLRILNFNYVGCHGPNYAIGGRLEGTSPEDIERLPQYNFVFVTYNSETRAGMMEFTNGE